MSNMFIGSNIGLVATRQVTSLDFCHVLCSRTIIEMKTCSHDRGTDFFPLYINKDYQNLTTKQPDLPGTIYELDDGPRNHNLYQDFVSILINKLSMNFITDGLSDLETTFGPEDVFHYIYAILHSPTYRKRYAEFLKVDFPRIPLTSNRELFRRLCALGGELVSLHLLEAPQLGQLMTRYPMPGDNRVERGYPRYTAESQRVYINPKQYFEGVPPQVWEFHIGGYQVLDKWLKDRRGRLLTLDDLTHYKKVTAALSETRRVMEEIDAAIPGWPVE